MFLQNRTLKLGSTAKSTKAVNFAKIRLRHLVDPVDRTVLATRIGRVAPLVCAVTSSARSCCHRVVRLLIAMGRIHALTVALAVQGRIRINSGTGFGPPHQIVLILAHGGIRIAIRTRRTVTIAIVVSFSRSTSLGVAKIAPLSRRTSLTVAIIAHLSRRPSLAIATVLACVR